MFIIPESLFTMPGIRVHVRLESVFTITRNTQHDTSPAPAAARRSGAVRRPSSCASVSSRVSPDTGPRARETCPPDTRPASLSRGPPPRRPVPARGEPPPGPWPSPGGSKVNLVFQDSGIAGKKEPARSVRLWELWDAAGVPSPCGNPRGWRISTRTTVSTALFACSRNEAGSSRHWSPGPVSSVL